MQMHTCSQDRQSASLPQRLFCRTRFCTTCSSANTHWLHSKMHTNGARCSRLMLCDCREAGNWRLLAQWKLSCCLFRLNYKDRWLFQINAAVAGSLLLHSEEFVLTLSYYQTNLLLPAPVHSYQFIYLSSQPHTHTSLTLYITALIFSKLPHELTFALI